MKKKKMNDLTNEEMQWIAIHHAYRRAKFDVDHWPVWMHSARDWDAYKAFVTACDATISAYENMPTKCAKLTEEEMQKNGKGI